MIDYTQLNADIAGWLRDVTGLDSDHVIPQNDTGPRPLAQYITYRVLDPNKVGHDAKRYETNAVDLTSVDINYIGLREMMVSINVLRGDALGQMAKLKNSFDRIVTQEYFRDKQIGIVNTSETRDLSAVVNDSWEERRQSDFFFTLLEEETVTVEAIETVEGTNLIDGKPYTVTSV